MKWMVWLLTIFLAVLLSLLHLRVDMARWCVEGLLSGEWERVIQVSVMVVHAVISVWLLLVLSLKNRVVAYGVLPMCVLLWAVPTYLHLSVGPCMYSELITAALETEIAELVPLLTPGMVVFLVLTCIGVPVLIYVYRRYAAHKVWVSTRRIWLGAVLYIGLTSLFVPLCVTCCPRALLPFLFHSVSETNVSRLWIQENQMATMVNETCHAYVYRVMLPYYRQFALVYHLVEYYRVKDIKKSESLTSRLLVDDDVIVCLVIGESYRSDHASWNGYRRETLPKLSAYRQNIVNFPYFKSFATSTVSSIYGILSDATCQRRTADHTSFLGVMKKHGFSSRLLLCRTTHWEYNPHINSVVDGKFEQVTECANTAEIEENMNQIACSPGKHMVILEDGTGHAPYEHESEFGCFGDSKVDKYDNCLLQTDDVLARVVNSLKNRKAVLLYCSDHGQSFGEQGCYMHGGALGVIKQRHVFSFLWYSDAFAEKHPDMITALRQNADKPLSHDDVYLSVLSLAGIECSLPASGCEDFTRPLNRKPVTEFSLENESRQHKEE